MAARTWRADGAEGAGRKEERAARAFGGVRLDRGGRRDGAAWDVEELSALERRRSVAYGRARGRL